MTAVIERRSTPGRGEGIFALKPFKRGDILYTGVLENASVTNHSHASQVSKTRFGFHIGLSSIFNHSCSPNCGIMINESGAHNIVAMESILAGDEATYDYAMRNYRIEHFPGSCSCGKTNCRNTITGWIGLPQQRKDDYAGFIAPYLLEIDLKQGAARHSAMASSRVLSDFKAATDNL
ncbi:SET domain-containing protein-lysine N-methyltransferase [Parerythrobacter jejuensis]|uniref:SET domain-containing protein-lysine N-methyltransferase n=1 Tax=Parerythrobacter jejuensis TaxID=795812 RepID=A0A845AV36_9SPHN|nr:SET domain-containing methyltransferase [Parerythrobacter jejuensis]MXP30293.1 SET domain-containing protein-lysine N-methyltransferase [Parerythrobacter jejuensis]MXP33053.1 SET domain-containing protein-lysine N-methyltransferase [Parerythrobacter jejuensis]